MRDRVTSSYFVSVELNRASSIENASSSNERETPGAEGGEKGGRGESSDRINFDVKANGKFKFFGLCRREQPS